MKRRDLAMGAAIVLPAGFAAFHLAASSSSPSAPPPPRATRPNADNSIRRAHHAYFAALAEAERVEAQPAFPFGSIEDEAQIEALEAALDRAKGAIADAARASARTLDGVRLKGVMLSNAIVAARALVLEATSPEIELAASVAVDIARLIPAEGGDA